jgi:hypothetical protein
MPELVIRPLQWETLPPLHEASALDETDMACLADLRAVLLRHGKVKRFAVHLAHKHFDLAPGEVLIERPDPDGRTQHVTVGRLDNEPMARPTTWIFEEGPALRLSDAVYCVCVSDPNKTDACVKHGRSSSPGQAHQKDERAKQERIKREEAAHRAGFTVAGHRRGRRRSRRGEPD